MTSSIDSAYREIVFTHVAKGLTEAERLTGFTFSLLPLSEEVDGWHLIIEATHPSKPQLNFRYEKIAQSKTIEFPTDMEPETLAILMLSGLEETALADLGADPSAPR